MGFRRPFYAEGRLKVAWILYRTVAWALPTDDVCGNDGERYEGFMFLLAKHTLPLPVVPNGECQVGLTVLALSLTLSHGERGSDNYSPTIVVIPYNLLPLLWGLAFAEMMANGMEFSVFRGRSPRYEFLLCRVVRFTCIRKGCKAELWVSDDLFMRKVV